MIDLRRKVPALAISLVVALASFSVQAALLCYDAAEQYPWILKDGKGLNIVLLEMASKESSEKFEMIALPWKRCLHSVEKGAMAGAFAASYSEERAQFAVYPMAAGKLDGTRRLMNDGYTLYRAKGSNVNWDGSKFSNLNGPIGTQASYSIAADLVKWGATVESSSHSPEALLRAVAGGYLQAVALLTAEGRYAVKKSEFGDRIEMVSPPLTEKPYFLIYGKNYYEKNRKMADDLWLRIAKARESTEYKATESSLRTLAIPSQAR